jgi:hypothetical protein
MVTKLETARAVVQLAATLGDKPGMVGVRQALVLVNELDTLQRQKDAALAIHRARRSNIFRHGVCVACSNSNRSGSVQYPCETAEALGVTREALDLNRAAGK